MAVPTADISRHKPAPITRTKKWAAHMHAAQHLVGEGKMLAAGDHLVDAMVLASGQKWRLVDADSQTSQRWSLRFQWATECYAAVGELMRANDREELPQKEEGEAA